MAGGTPMVWDAGTLVAHADEVVRSIKCYGSADMKSWAEQ